MLSLALEFRLNGWRSLESSLSNKLIENFQRVDKFFLCTQKEIKKFNESRFKCRKVKRRATSSEIRKVFVVVVKSALGIVKKMLTNGGFVKLLWAYVGLARAGKALGVV